MLRRLSATDSNSGRFAWNSLSWEVFHGAAFAIVLCVSHVVMTKAEAGDTTVVAQATATQKKEAKAEKAEKEAGPKTITWAQITIKNDYTEGAKAPGLFGDLEEKLTDLQKRLISAGEDKNIGGIFLNIQTTAMGRGTLNEITTTIAKVRAMGKPVYAWVESGNAGDYLIGAACDKVYQPEASMLMLTGLQMEIGFYKDMLDKLGVKTEVLAVGDYKAAGEPYSRSHMSPAYKEEMDAIIDSLYDQMVTALAKSRSKSNDDIKKLIDNGPYSSEQAHKLGLLDGLCYQDQFDDLIKERYKEEVVIKIDEKYGKKKVDLDFEGFGGMVKMMNLLMGIEAEPKKNLLPKVAIIYAVGPIMTGKSMNDPLSGSVMGSETIIKAVKEAADNQNVKAIVLRVDSPGGSALASDLMWRALEECKKPIVVSMGNVAASGGYYISMGADYIYAEPGTITGSIGVISMKLALEGLYEKFGINTDIISRGKNSGIMSSTSPFTEEQKTAMRALSLDIYGQFTRKAAEGRKMKLEDLVKLAGGRVYTGEAAVKNHLIDEVGTLTDAIAKAKSLAGLSDDTKIDELSLPKATSPFEALFGDLEAGVSMNGVSSNLVLSQMQSLKATFPEQFKLVSQHLNGLWGLLQLHNEPQMLMMPYSIIVR